MALLTNLHVVKTIQKQTKKHIFITIHKIEIIFLLFFSKVIQIKWKQIYRIVGKELKSNILQILLISIVFFIYFCYFLSYKWNHICVIFCKIFSCFIICILWILTFFSLFLKYKIYFLFYCLSESEEFEVKSCL